MNNQLKSKTRLAFIQVIFQYISTKNNINEILETFILNYKSTFIESFRDKKKIKFEFNNSFLTKLVNSYVKYVKNKEYLAKINEQIQFNRTFEKWDIINQSILLAAICEIENTETIKIKIVLNDYLNISKLFINKNDIAYINAIIDKIINEKK